MLFLVSMITKKKEKSWVIQCVVQNVGRKIAVIINFVIIVESIYKDVWKYSTFVQLAEIAGPKVTTAQNVEVNLKESKIKLMKD